ncbi:MAG: hypothetical protein O3C21_20720 [Verrucomicrobia bacterium]|nr:hypothetical protein [Verrucomicrobiota bacterium]
MKAHIGTAKRREIVDCVGYWASQTQLTAKTLATLIGLPYGKFLRWRKRLQVGSDTASVPTRVIPRSHWLLPAEIAAIVHYCVENPGHGYRRLTWMMTDADVVYASPSSVYRVLKRHSMLQTQEGKESRKGKGFDQPSVPHQHWHVDFSYFKIGGVFYYFMTSCPWSMVTHAPSSPGICAEKWSNAMPKSSSNEPEKPIQRPSVRASSPIAARNSAATTSRASCKTTTPRSYHQ